MSAELSKRPLSSHRETADQIRLSRRQAGKILLWEGGLLALVSLGSGFAKGRQTHAPEDYEDPSLTSEEKHSMHQSDRRQYKKLLVGLSGTVTELVVAGFGAYKVLENSEVVTQLQKPDREVFNANANSQTT